MALVNKNFSDIITFTRASTATFFNSAGVLTSAATNAPRFDYNPSTLAAQGLLIEESRANLFPASNDFSNATYWTVYGTAVATGAAAIGPDGLTSASNLAGATDITLSGNNIEETVTVSASTAYEFSVFVKSNGGTTVTLRMRDSTGGSTSSSAFTVTSSWQRISVSRTMAVGATSTRCIIGATNGDILIYGAQLEAGAFPTSYIPTTTTALTRAADVASVNTLSPWFNAVASTIYAEYQPVSAIASQLAVAFIDTGTGSTNRATVGVSSAGTSYSAAMVDGGAVQANLTQGTFSTSAVKNAFAFSANDFAFSVNGASPAVDTSGTVSSAFTLMQLGSRGGSFPLNGYLRRITYYPRRLSNAELQAITA
jgi:hypothetical protein